MELAEYTSPRMKKVFDGRKPEDKVMNLFLTAGYPSIEETLDLMRGYAANGAEILEVGMPFSDPLADGPTIQFSSEEAIRNGITMKKILETIKAFREGSETPVVLMGYLNSVLQYGLEAFFRDASDAGVDGLILPDVPVEESSIIKPYAKKHGVPLIYLVAPNSTDERMKLIDRESNGFVYCVSITGVTGARKGGEIEQSVSRFIDRVNRNISRNPVLIGFGISTHDDAMKISAKTQGFVVGSALINHIRSVYGQTDWLNTHLKYVRSLRYGNKNSN